MKYTNWEIFDNFPKEIKYFIHKWNANELQIQRFINKHGIDMAIEVCSSITDEEVRKKLERGNN